MTFPKTCTYCGAVLSKEEWLKLRLIGRQSDERDPPEVIELRNCKCVTTLAMPVEAIHG